MTAYLPAYCAANIHQFDFVHGIIRIPSQFVWYRAYALDTPILSQNPQFFGDRTVSLKYAKGKGRPLGEFQPVRELRLLDMRYVMSILPYMLNHEFRSHQIAKKLVASLGLCTMPKQIELLTELIADDYPQAAPFIDRMRQFCNLETKPDWVHPFEIQGVRAGITNIDYEVMIWLKKLFESVVDGIIAPSMPSPFHDQVYTDIERSMLYSELILFSPANVLRHIHNVPLEERPEYDRLTLDFNDLIRDQFQGQWLRHPRNIRYSAMGGKGTSTFEIRDAYAEELMRNPKLQKELDRKVRGWMPIIRRIQKSDRFLQQESVTLWSVKPDQNAVHYFGSGKI